MIVTIPIYSSIKYVKFKNQKKELEAGAVARSSRAFAFTTLAYDGLRFDP